MTRIAELFQTLDYGPAPESATPALAWLDAHQRRFSHFVGGAWMEPSEGGRFPAVNPATGEELAQVAQGSSPDVARAVEAASEALEGWQEMGGSGRARVLYALARGLQRHARLFAVLESMDNGKPIRESRDLDIPLVARHFYHHAGWAQLLEEEFPGQEAHGVVGQIIPWNFPLLMLAWKVAPALAAGNTVILKPAEYTSLTALLFAEMAVEAGLPPGVLNILTGDGKTGAALVAHPEISKIAFTGSTEVGRSIRTATAGTGKALTLELGGKSPFLVYDDADLDSVVEGVVDAIWFNQGQVCCAGSRILAQEGIALELEEKLRRRMETLRMGNPLEKGVDLGAIVAPVQLERIRELVAQGEEEGARVWQPSWAVPEEGLFYPPTLCTGVEPAGTLAQVEIFGPVVALMTFRTPDESVVLANNTRYGLAASVWTEDINLALDIAPRIEAGTVWVNCTNLFDAASEFGGVRESGFGREGGRGGMLEYLRPVRPDPEGVEGVPELRPSSRVVPADTAPAVPSGTRAVGADGDEAAPRTAAGPKARLDRTPKLYIGGKQARPDGGHSLRVLREDGSLAGTVPRGNRKDIRNAVAAARKALPGWASLPAHHRAQILYFLAENLDARREGFVAGLQRDGGLEAKAAETEVELSVQRLFSAAAWTDKWDGRVHSTPFRNVTLGMVEPVGVLGVACPAEAPLLALLSTLGPALAMGNVVVALPSPSFPLAATDLYQVLDTSDVPAGVVNLVTGLPGEVLPTLADHDDVDGLWSFGDREEAREVERRSVGNLKRTWTAGGRSRRWAHPEDGEGEEFYRHATRLKNIWVPYGA